MRKLVALVTLLLPVAAEAQFNGYVGLQTVMVPVVLNTASTGRFKVNANIGSSYHTLTYCLSTPSTALQLIVEQSPDGQDAHFTQVSPISEFPWQAINNNSCGVIRVGGYYSILAVNVLLLSGGTISIWYTGTAGPTDIYPPAVNSSGGTSPAECDQSLVFSQLAPGAVYQLVTGNPNQGIYICGGTLSFDGATSSGSIQMQVGGTNCGGITQASLPLKRHIGKGVTVTQAPRFPPAKPAGRPPALAAGTPVWFSYVTVQTPQVFPINAAKSTIRIPPTTAGSSLCLNVGAITADVGLTLTFAQF